MAVLKDVVFAYVKIQQPTKKYESTDTEWTVDCVVSEKEAKAFKKEFKKQPPKEFDNDKFKEIFRIDPPFPDQEEQYVIKLKKNTHTADGKAMPEKARPRVFVKGESGKLQDITFEVLVANGSTGVVQYDVVENKFGKFAKLKAVRVDHLIPYTQDANFDELGEVDELATSTNELEDEQKSPQPDTNIDDDVEY